MIYGATVYELGIGLTFFLPCGTMIPVHLFWFLPAVISTGDFDAFDIATVVIIFYGLISVELLLLVFFYA